MTMLVMKNREGVYVQVETFLLGSHRDGVGMVSELNLVSPKESKAAMKSHLKYDTGNRRKPSRLKALGW